MKSWWSKAIKRLAVLQELHSPGDVVLFLRILGFAFIVPLFLRLQLPKLEALLEPKNPPKPPKPERINQIANYVDGALLLSRPLIRPGCLTRGLTMYYFLRGAGVDVVLNFGLGIDEDEVGGHCWMVRDSEPFLEARDPRPLFTEVYRFPEGITSQGGTPS